MPVVDPRIEGLRTEALAALASASDEAGLEQWRITFFGRQDGRQPLGASAELLQHEYLKDTYLGAR
jgi:hypothetical protein